MEIGEKALFARCRLYFSVHNRLWKIRGHCEKFSTEFSCPLVKTDRRENYRLLRAIFKGNQHFGRAWPHTFRSPDRQTDRGNAPVARYSIIRKIDFPFSSGFIPRNSDVLIGWKLRCLFGTRAPFRLQMPNNCIGMSFRHRCLRSISICWQIPCNPTVRRPSPAFAHQKP